MALNVAIIDGMSSSTAGDLVSSLNSFLSQEGVVVTDGTDLNVTQADTPAMSVEVKAGTCFVINDNFTKNSGDIKYWHVTLTIDTEVTIDANSSGSTRIDGICVKVDTGASPDATASNVASLVAVKGTPGAGNPTIPDEHLLLTFVTVEDGETQILNADLSDQRQYFGIALPHGTEGYRMRDTGGALDAQLYEDSAGDVYLIGSKSGGGIRISQSANTINKRSQASEAWSPISGVSPRVSTQTSNATPTINTDNVDAHSITALAVAVTSMTTNLSGTPTNFQKLIIRFLDDGTGRAITWGASFQAMGADLPTTTTANKVLTVGLIYDSVDSKWGCVAAPVEA